MNKFVVLNHGIDSDGDMIIPSGITFKNPVPVLRDFSTKPEDVLGNCDLSYEGESIVAKSDISENLYPAIGFQIIKCHQDGGVRVIDECKIHYVGLSDNPNIDPSIMRINEQ